MLLCYSNFCDGKVRHRFTDNNNYLFYNYYELNFGLSLFLVLMGQYWFTISQILAILVVSRYPQYSIFAHFEYNSWKYWYCAEHVFLAKRSRRKKTWDGFLDGPLVSKDKTPLGGASVTGTSYEKGRQ